MLDAWTRYARRDEGTEPVPRDARLLAPSPQGAEPMSDHVRPECCQRLRVARDCEVVEVTAQDAGQPTGRVFQGKMTVFQQRHLDRLTLGPQPLGDGLAFHREPA